MTGRYYELPSLTSLAVFEASARHSSLKLAEVELRVRFGRGTWSDETSEFLFDECVLSGL